ncbi:MAG: hypothetical protein GX096_12815 [Clostridiales bacterium]|nr:hypothetical protein [Clostridiales bacterium]
MNNRALENNEIRRVMDTCLPGLENNSDFDLEVLRQVRGEVKVKKKLSIGFVLVIAIILITVTALAASLLWQDYATEIKNVEQEQGEYQNWEIEDKQHLLQILVDLGEIEPSEAMEELRNEATPEQQKHQLADQLVLSVLENDEYMSRFAEDGLNAVSWLSLTYAVMGYETTWTPEQRVWLQEIEAQYGLDINAGDYTFVLPSKEEISETEAVAIAKDGIIRAWNLPQNELDQAIVVADLYVTEERPNYKRWFVEFMLNCDNEDVMDDRGYWAFVDGTGHLIEDTDRSAELIIETPVNRLLSAGEEPVPPLIETYSHYMIYELNVLVRNWSIEAKAEYSAEVRPQVQALLESGDLAPITNPNSRYPLPNPEILASTHYAYGLPSGDAVQESEALELARKMIEETFGTPAETLLSDWSFYVYYDVTNEAQPLWRVIYYPISFEGMAAVPVYRVELDGKTGERVSLEQNEWQDLYDESLFNLKWY